MPSENHPLERLVRKLRLHAPLSDDDAALLLALPYTVRTMEPAQYIVREGDAPKLCVTLISGYTFRQKITTRGDRQIIAINIPGDPVDFGNLFVDIADHSVQALTSAQIASISRVAVQELLRANPRIAVAVLALMQIETSIAREWLLNIGRRDARTRLAHFLCEFALRLDAQGLKGSEGYELPMTQEQLGDTLGLTSVHVNRTLKALEAEGALHREGRRILFADWAGLRRTAGFSALYLHVAEGQAPARQS